MPSISTALVKSCLTDESRLNELPFDQYQRYRDLKEVVEHLRSVSAPLKLLDVGGGEAGYLPAPSFFPKDLVIVADRHALQLPNYVVADGASLPFSDGAFDIAFSCDTLEHVPPDRRERFLGELFRVSRHFVVLTAPFFSPLTETAEQLLQEVYISECGEANKALMEHAINGLPDLEATQATFRKLSAAHLSFPSGNIYNWLIMNSIAFTFGSLSVELYRCANRIYNERFYFHDHFPPAYRTCLVGAKSEKAIPPLDQLKKKLAPWTVKSDYISSPRNSVEDSSAFTDFYSWRQALRTLKGVTRARDVHIGNLNQIIRDKDLYLQDLLAHAQNLTGQVQRNVQELKDIQNSNGWRALQRYYKIRDRTFPAGSKRRMVISFLRRLATSASASPQKPGWHDL